MATREPGARRAASGESDWLTLGQAAKFLGVAQSTIRKWSDVGRVPAFYTPGGHRRYRRADLDLFLERSGPNARGREGPVVMFSGKAEVGEEAASRGAQGFVGKPFDLQRLIDQTKSLLPV